MCLARSGAIRLRRRVFFRPLSRAGPLRRLRRSIPPTGLDPLLGPDTAAFREYIVKSVEQTVLHAGSSDRVDHPLPPARPQFRLRRLHFSAQRCAHRRGSGLVRQRVARPGADRRRGNAARCFGSGKAGASFRCRFEAACRLCWTKRRITRRIHLSASIFPKRDACAIRSAM